MNNQEAKAMLGTEYDHIFSDGDSMKAYVKAYDPKIGLTCMSFGDVTEDGYVYPNYRLDKEGSVCMVGIDFKKGEGKKRLSIRVLEQIKKKGSYTVKPTGGFGGPSCSF